MTFTEKIIARIADNLNNPPLTAAFLGDSVTQGCFEIYKTSDGGIETYYDQGHAYHKYFKDILNTIYPSVPVNIINAGVNGDNAPHGLTRLERDVLSHSPDLAVVCFGLNDSCCGEKGLDNYINALREIFTRIKAAGIQLIFMTPNMMCTSVSCHLQDNAMRQIAESCSKIQNNGILDLYIQSAKDLCRSLDVTVCDCYSRWKKLESCGADITDLLANYINHPTREMSRLSAVSLVETIFNS